MSEYELKSGHNVTNPARSEASDAGRDAAIESAKTATKDLRHKVERVPAILSKTDDDGKVIEFTGHKYMGGSQPVEITGVTINGQHRVLKESFEADFVQPREGENAAVATLKNFLGTPVNKNSGELKPHSEEEMNKVYKEVAEEISNEIAKENPLSKEIMAKAMEVNEAVKKQGGPTREQSLKAVEHMPDYSVGNDGVKGSERTF